VAPTVLTATGLVNKKEQTLTPTEATPLNRSPKYFNIMFATCDYVAHSYSVYLCQNVAQIRPRRLLRKWGQYNGNFVYLLIYASLFRNKMQTLREKIFVDFWKQPCRSDSLTDFRVRCNHHYLMRVCVNYAKGST